MARDYTQLITSEHVDKPRFVATVALTTGMLGQAADAALSLTPAFSLDAAVGAQLDKVGLWVGISRNQNIPIPDAYFSWDTEGLGWDQANWKAPYDPVEGITTLDDATYRAVLKAKIGSNYWAGTNETLQVIAESAFADLGVQCFVVDNFDMSVTVYILGAPTAVLVALIKRGVVPPKTAGVRVAGYILASEPGAPFFALDAYTTSEVAGLDFGSFGDPI